jgi:hypothetical protein
MGLFDTLRNTFNKLNKRIFGPRHESIKDQILRLEQELEQEGVWYKDEMDDFYITLKVLQEDIQAERSKIQTHFLESVYEAVYDPDSSIKVESWEDFIRVLDNSYMDAVEFEFIYLQNKDVAERNSSDRIERAIRDFANNYESNTDPKVQKLLNLYCSKDFMIESLALLKRPTQSMSFKEGTWQVIIEEDTPPLDPGQRLEQ